MKAVRGRCAFLACVLSTFFVVSGCTVGSKSFSIDSNSRIPFFGLELRDRGPKSTAPVYKSISRSNATSGEVVVAMQSNPSISAMTAKKSEPRIRAIEGGRPASPVSSKASAETAGAALPSLFIPLTRASDKPAAKSGTASASVDFQ